MIQYTYHGKFLYTSATFFCRRYYGSINANCFIEPTAKTKAAIWQLLKAKMKLSTLVTKYWAGSFAIKLDAAKTVGLRTPENASFHCLTQHKILFSFFSFFV